MPLLDVFKNSMQGAVSGVLDGAAAIIGKFKADPTKVVEIEADLEKLRQETQVKMADAEVKMAEVQAKELETVNQTMREEAKSEKWMQYSWRPTIGFTFCAILINNYILIPYLGKYGAQMITVPDTVFTAILVILGAASAGRGFKHFAEAKK